MQLARFLQTRKCVPATLAKRASSTASDLSPFNILSDLSLAQVVMERQPWILEYQQ